MTARLVVIVSLWCAVVGAGCNSGGEAQGRDDGASPTPTGQARERPRVEVLAGGLVVPWDIAFLPDGRALVSERPGRIRLLSPTGTLQRAPVGRIAVDANGEGGLMGLAVDPEFGPEQPFAYAMVTAGREVRVLRLRWAGDRLIVEATVLAGILAGSIHDAGRLRFGPDDRLYVVTGDAGRKGLAQQRTSRNGKILALTPDQYRGDEPAGPAIVSIGHRNPQGLGWQPGTDRLFVTEHGPSGFDGPSCCDELNLVRQGRDYGWPRYGHDQPDAARPALMWQRTIAPSGLAFASREGSAWTGTVLVAALRGMALHRVRVDGEEAEELEVLLEEDYGRLRAVTEAPDGSFWVSTSNRDAYGERVSPEDDRILRIVPPPR